MGVALLEKGRVDEAHGHFVRSLAIKETERAHSWMGLVLASQGRPEEAIAEYRAGLALDPGSIETHTNLGIALAMQGRLAEALPHFERACELDPSDEESRVNLDRARRELGLSRRP
jgi:Flp pilus assembly protein TadD